MKPGLSTKLQVETPSTKPLVEDEIPVPRLPSINDPFNLFGCSQLPFPLTPDEDIILKHILNICASDYQMSKRAYDSIICMWAKKNQTDVPKITSVNPESVPIVPQFPIAFTLTVTGTNFKPGAKLLWDGSEHPILDNTGTVITAAMEIRPLIETEVYKFIGKNVAILNPDGKMSSVYGIATDNPIYGSGPRITTVTPNPVTGIPTATGGSFDLTITGQDFAYPQNEVEVLFEGRSYHPKSGFSTQTSMVVTVSIGPYVAGQPKQIQIVNGGKIWGPGTSITVNP